MRKKYIFHINSDTQTIYRMDKDGNCKVELNSARSSSLNMIGDWIFYEKQNCDYEIYKMGFDGSRSQMIY